MRLSIIIAVLESYEVVRRQLLHFIKMDLPQDIEFIIMDFAGWNLQMLIRTGRFLTFMLRPVSHRFFAVRKSFRGIF